MRIALILLTSCTTYVAPLTPTSPADVDPLWASDMQAPPTGPVDSTLSLTVNGDIGEDIVFTVTGAAPGQGIAILRSPTQGASTFCPNALNNNCLDLEQPEFVFLGVADASGSATVTRMLPPGTPHGSTMWYQAGAAGTGLVNPNLSAPTQLSAWLCPGDDGLEDASHLDYRVPGPANTFETLHDHLVLCPVLPQGGTGWDSGIPTYEDVDLYGLTVPPGKLAFVVMEFDQSTDASQIVLSKTFEDYPVQGQSVSEYRGIGLHQIGYNPSFDGTPIDMTFGARAFMPQGSQLGAPYQIRYKIADPCDDDLNEPNNGSASASTMQQWIGGSLTGAAQTGYLCSGDEDWYLVPAGLGSTRYVATSSFDTHVSLEVIQGGAVVATASTASPLSTLGTTRYQVQPMTIPAFAGDTYIRVVPGADTDTLAGGWYNIYTATTANGYNF